jgi:hypothetical protein
LIAVAVVGVVIALLLLRGDPSDRPGVGNPRNLSTIPAALPTRVVLAAGGALGRRFSASSPKV